MQATFLGVAHLSDLEETALKVFLPKIVLDLRLLISICKTWEWCRVGRW